MSTKTEIISGKYYRNYQGRPSYRIISISDENDPRVTFETLHSKVVSTKTLAYCQKYMKYDEQLNRENGTHNEPTDSLTE